jgi:hypothetical protein
MVHIYKGKGLILKNEITKKMKRRKTCPHAYFECFKHIKKTPKT